MEKPNNAQLNAFIQKMQQSLSAHGYALEVESEKSEFTVVTIGLGTIRSSYYVKHSMLRKFEKLCGQNDLEIAAVRPEVTLAHEIYTVKNSIRILIGLDGIPSRGQQHTTYFELGWLLPPYERIKALRSDWQAPTHLAASMLDITSYFNLQQYSFDPATEDLTRLLEIYTMMYDSMYADFSYLVQKHLTNELITQYHTHERSVRGVLDENNALIAPLITTILSMTVAKILDLAPQLSSIQAAKLVDYQSFKALIRALGIGANGTLGREGGAFEAAHFDITPTATNRKQIFSMALNQQWEEHVKNRQLRHSVVKEAFRKTYTALLPVSSFTLPCFGRAGFDYATTGLCPVYFESPGLTHAYDIWVDALEHLIQSCVTES